MQCLPKANHRKPTTVQPVYANPPATQPTREVAQFTLCNFQGGNFKLSVSSQESSFRKNKIKLNKTSSSPAASLNSSYNCSFPFPSFDFRHEFWQRQKKLIPGDFTIFIAVVIMSVTSFFRESCWNSIILFFAYSLVNFSNLTIIIIMISLLLNDAFCFQYYYYY